MFSRLLSVALIVVAAWFVGCSSLTPSPPIPKGSRVVCWDNGQQLFDMVVYDASSNGTQIDVTFTTGRKAKIHASPCIIAEMSPEELAAPPRPAPAPAHAAVPPTERNIAPTSPQANVIVPITPAAMAAAAASPVTPAPVSPPPTKK